MARLAIVLLPGGVAAETCDVPAGLQLSGLGDGAHDAAVVASKAHLAYLAAREVLDEHGIAAGAQVVGIAVAIPAEDGRHGGVESGA